MSNPIIEVDEHTYDYLNNMPYKIYLSTDYWKNLKKLYYEQREKKCFICNTESDVHLRHFDYEARGKKTFSDLVSLCENCHFALHDSQEHILI